MQIIMTARHFALNDNFKNAVRTRINKIENQFEILSRADVILTWEKSQFHVNLKIDGTKQHFHATAADYDLLRAVDQAVRHIRSQADKFYKKVSEHFKHHLSQREILERIEATTSDPLS